MEIALFGINILLIIFAWHFMLRKTILDHSRDQLFDLRDELRNEFVNNGWDLGSQDYKKLRDLINAHLRFTEQVSILRILLVTVEIKRNTELKDFLRIRLEKVFVSNIPAQQEFIKKFRMKALAVVMSYAVFSSGFLLLAALAISPIVAVKKLVEMINRRVDMTLDACLEKFKHLGAYTAVTMSASTAFIARSIFSPELVESYCFKRNHHSRN
jgi:hypothetical protein